MLKSVSFVINQQDLSRNFVEVEDYLAVKNVHNIRPAGFAGPQCSATYV